MERPSRTEGTHEGAFPGGAARSPRQSGEEAFALRRGREPPPRPFDAAFRRPAGQERPRAGPAGEARVPLPGDLHPRRPRLGDDGRRSRRPGLRKRSSVVDLEGGPRFPDDGEPLRAVLRGRGRGGSPGTPVPGGNPRQDGQFLRRGERPSGGSPSRAPARLPPSPGRRETPVRSDSAGVASPFPAAADGSAHLPGTHRGHRFGTDSGGFQSVRTAAERCPVALEGPRHHHRGSSTAGPADRCSRSTSVAAPCATLPSARGSTGRRYSVVGLPTDEARVGRRPGRVRDLPPPAAAPPATGRRGNR